MSDFAGDETAALPAPASPADGRAGRLAPPSARYTVSLLLVAAATALAFVARELIAAPNLTLIYVLPVVIAATVFGWGPALIAALGGVLAFDFFFTAPYFSFRIYSAADVWAAALLLATAAIVTTVSSEARRRTLEAHRAREQAEALQSLAHAVIEHRPRGEILEAAATALHRLFRAPVVIYLQDGSDLRRAAAAGDPEIGPRDEEAARGALSAGLHTRGATYPYDEAEFEFWPVRSASGRRCVMGVDFARADGDRPEAPERYADLVAAYLATSLDAAPAAA